METLYDTYRRIFIPAQIIFSILLFSVFSTGCGAVGMIAGGSINQFTGTYEINLETTHANILDVLTDVGKELDMSVYELDNTNHKITLSSGFSSASAGLIGKSSSSALSVVLTDSLKNLAVAVTVQGNFGYGTKETADKIFNDFKGKLLAKLQ
jgi:hypothetical protein